MDKKAELKPQMPKERIVFSGIAEAHLMMDMERFSSGHMFMGIDRASVMSDGVEIGEVNLCMGCAVGVEVNGRTWGIDPLDLYKIAKQADDAYVASLKVVPMDVHGEDCP